MHRLFLFEGLPGSGKSTFSQDFYLQRCRAGADVSWFAEDQRPHPLIDEPALGQIESPDELAEYAKKRWRKIVKDTLTSDSLVVLDAALFGLTLGGLLRWETPQDMLAKTATDIETTLAPLDPVMVYLRPKDVGGAFDGVLNTRGPYWTNYMADELSSSRFALARNATGIDLVRTYHHELDRLFNSVYEGLSLTKHAIDIVHGYFGNARAQIQTALGKDTAPAVPPSPEWLESLAGTYRSIEDDASLTLRKDTKGLVIDQDHGSRLIHTDGNSFMVQSMAVDVTFEVHHSGPTHAIFCARTADSTAVPTEWVKV